MKISKSGLVERIYRNDVYGTWALKVKVSPYMYQTYVGLKKRPKLCIGDHVLAGQEIENIKENKNETKNRK